MGAVLGVLLRNYGFTDLPPPLPLPRSDPVTRIRKSNYHRIATEDASRFFFVASSEGQHREDFKHNCGGFDQRREWHR